MDASVAGETLEFEGWRFDTRNGNLLTEDPHGTWAPVSLGARARDVLTILLQQPGTLVSKDAILDAVWPNVTVEPNNLTVQIATLRRTLDDGRAGKAASRRCRAKAIGSSFAYQNARPELRGGPGG